MRSRREFLDTSARASLGVGLSTLSTSAGAPPFNKTRNQRDSMRYRPLGTTGMTVSEVVMGGNEITPENYEHVLEALDHGLNYLDTSPAYGAGKSELGFAKVIHARPRDQFYLTSKVSLWDTNRGQLYQDIFESLDATTQRRLSAQVQDEIEESGVAKDDYIVNYFGSQRKELESAILCSIMEKAYGRRIDREKNYKQLILKSTEESLRRLGVDYLDTLMCPHGASSGQELLNYPEILEAFEELKESGKVRFLGVSSHSDPAGVLRAARESGAFSVAMVAYNIVNHTYMDTAIAEAKASGIGVIAMKVARPVYAGPNRKPAAPQSVADLQEAIPGDWTIPQKAYLWALKNPNLSAVISNIVNLEQTRANLKLPAVNTAKED